IQQLIAEWDVPDSGILPEAGIFEDDSAIIGGRWPWYTPPPTSPLGRWGTMSPALGAWQSEGPGNISGRIKCLAIPPRDGRTVYAGAANGGVWKTSNAGATWYPTMSQELSLAIGAIGISDSQPETLYAATGEFTAQWVPSFPGAGVYKTVDGGLHW